MGKNTVAPRPVQKKAPLTLADVCVVWEYGGAEYVVTGRQIAYLLTAGVERIPSGFLGPALPESGQWSYKLRGLAALCAPEMHDRENPDRESFLSDVLERAAADLAADAMDSERWPEKFVVNIKPGSGRATAGKQLAPDRNGRAA